jgi:hypothetical protein
MRHVVFAAIAVLSLAACEKKYTCHCSGYEGLMGAKDFKFRSGDPSSATTTCTSYEEGSEADGTDCELIE